MSNTATTAVSLSPPVDFAALRQALAVRADSLSPRLRDCAEYVLREPDQTALGTISQIAAAAGVPPSAMVRFAQALGYSGFSDLQQVFQRHVTDRWPGYARRLEALREVGQTSGSHLLMGLVDQAHISLDRLRQDFNLHCMDKTVTVLAGAKRIELLGLRRAFPVAAYLHYILGRLGVHAVLLDAVGGVLTDRGQFLESDDALFVVSFAPYSQETLAYANAASGRGVPLVALTDTAISPLARVADCVLEVSDAELGGFRSLSATMCVATALAVAVSEARRVETAS